MFNGATNYAESVDNVMLFIIGTSVFLLVGITAAMIYFVFKYSRKKNPVATQIHGNITLEVIWIVIPTIIVMVMFWYGFKDYKNLRAYQDDAFQVNVWAYMWGWDFEYPNGKKTDTLYIPLSQVTRLELESRDVNHSLYIPSFRLKEDVVGGQKHYMILTPNNEGVYDIACAEYCGLNHSYMYTKVYVMDDDAFDEWYNSEDKYPNHKKKVVDMQNVESTYQEKLTKSKDFSLLGEKGCISCHTTDGSKSIGPSFLELADGKVEVKKDDEVHKIKVTKEYLKNSIVNPDDEIVEGYQKFMMPSQKHLINDEEMERIINLLMPTEK